MDEERPTDSAHDDTATGSRRRALIDERDGRTRQALIEAARVVIERDGFHDGRIVDIATTAGVGVGTFYRHFDSKMAVFCAVVEQTFDDIDLRGGQHTDPSPTVRIETANRRFFDHYRRYARLHSVFEQLAPIDAQCRQLYLTGRERAVRRLTRAIVAWQQAGVVDSSLDADQTARLLISMANDHARMAFVLGEPFDEERCLEALRAVWFRTLAIDPASLPPRTPPST